MKNTLQLIQVKQVNGHVCKINPWQIVRVDDFVESYSITFSNSHVLDFSKSDPANEKIVKFIDKASKEVL